MEEIRRPNRNRYAPMSMNYNEWVNYKNSIGMFFFYAFGHGPRKTTKN